MVPGPAPEPKSTVLGAAEGLARLALVLTLAQLTAVRRLPRSFVSAAELTWYSELAS